MVHAIEASRQIKSHFFLKWKELLLDGLPDACPPVLPVVFEKSGVPYEPLVFFKNVELATVAPTDEHFVRFSFSDALTEQSSLTGGIANNLKTRYTSVGVGFVELFFSKSNYSTEEEDYLCLVAQSVFLNTRTTNVVFRNSTIVAMNPEEKYFRARVSFDYEYDSAI